MLNIKELEKKWLRYKIKSYIIHAIVILLIIIFLIIFYIYKENSVKTVHVESKTITTQKETKIIKSKEMIQKVKLTPTIVNQNNIIKPDFEDEKDSKLILYPSYKFIDNFNLDEGNTNSYKNKKPNIKKKVDIKKDTRVTIKSNSTNLEEIIKRFNNTKNPNLSLFIAKKYYQLKDYKNSYNYSLKTNRLDSSVEDSWIVFSKSLVKLNKTKMAISILNKYIKSSNSKKAKSLLKKINSGVFK